MTNAEPSKKTYVVRGADRQTGESRIEVIDAIDEQEATVFASARGLLVATIAEHHPGEPIGDPNVNPKHEPIGKRRHTSPPTRQEIGAPPLNNDFKCSVWKDRAKTVAATIAFLIVLYSFVISRVNNALIEDLYDRLEKMQRQNIAEEEAILRTFETFNINTTDFYNRVEALEKLARSRGVVLSP